MKVSATPGEIACGSEQIEATEAHSSEHIGFRSYTQKLVTA
jgi:hypothetical protein